MKLLIHNNNSKYIRCSMFHARKYERINPKEVTEGFINNYCKYNNILLSDNNFNAIIEGILSWKSQCGICYHHINLNTNSNRASNIALVSSSAHGYIHTPSVEIKLFRYYDLLLPGYTQGPKAEQLEQKMYSRLFKDIAQFTEYSAEQIINAIRPLFYNIDLTSHQIADKLFDSDIYYIDYEHVHYIVDEIDFDPNTVASVEYVDNVTGNKIIDSLENWEAEDEYEEHTINCIIEFIKSNQLSRKQIDKYCKQLENQK